MPRSHNKSQKAPSTTRCIKTLASCVSPWRGSSQKAPSTTRCIKTCRRRRRASRGSHVRKHPAPEGALRHESIALNRHSGTIRKHPAPQGALRREVVLHGVLLGLVKKHPAPQGALRPCRYRLCGEAAPRQKAPSTRRCIETTRDQYYTYSVFQARKHPAPLGALRRLHQGPSVVVRQLESTWHQKCIKTRQNCR